MENKKKMSKYRYAIGSRQSKSMFAKGGSRTHKYNTYDTIMRGGIRL